MENPRRRTLRRKPIMARLARSAPGVVVFGVLLVSSVGGVALKVAETLSLRPAEVFEERRRA